MERAGRLREFMQACRKDTAIWTTDEGEYLRLCEVFLLPDCQGQGIGSQLLKQELARARRLHKPLRVSVLRANRARALYERLGFAVCGEIETILNSSSR
jgi:ribosomal protein S18 acetylase RimI-like enzyme